LDMTESRLRGPEYSMTQGHAMKVMKHITSLNQVSFDCSLSSIFFYFFSRLLRLVTMPRCFICRKNFGRVKVLLHHLRQTHTVLEPRCELRCAETIGCCRTFNKYNSFRRHLLSHDYVDSTTCAATSKKECADNNIDANSADDIVNESLETPNFDSKQPSQSESKGQNVQLAAAHFLLYLASSSSATLSHVKYVQDAVTDLFLTAISDIKEAASVVFLQLPHSAANANFFELLESWRNPFRNIETFYKLQKYMNNARGFVAPQECTLGIRRESTENQQQKTANDTFMYVPIAKTLQSIFQFQHSWDVMDDVSAQPTEIISSYLDGSNCRKILPMVEAACGVGTTPIFLQLYYDDFETANPLGSRATIHKLGGFYFTVANFPSRLNSDLNNIHLAALVYTQDIKKYGMSAVLTTLRDELLVLERGFEIVLEDGSRRRVCCVLANIVGDNLGLHALLGYTESFRHDNACDLCTSSIEDMQTIFTERGFQCRTVESYNKQVQALETMKAPQIHIEGLKSACCLDKLQFYHPARNDTGDVMHDILEGVAPYEVHLMLYDFIYVRKLFTLDQLNSRLRFFDYGPVLSKSKPADITHAKLHQCGSANVGQKAHEMLVLLYVLPFAIADYIPADDRTWRIFLLLLDICDIVFAPTLTAGQATYLAELIADHHSLLKQQYPDRTLKYKHHRMVHYPALILANGPLLRMWVIRYEAKHNYFKRLAHIVCNFKNICKTLAHRNQTHQCFVWFKSPPFKTALHVGPGYETLIGSQPELKFERDISLYSEAFCAEWIVVHGTKYKPGLTLILDCDEDHSEPQFGYVNKIFVINDRVHFAISKWVVYHYDYALHSYSCRLSTDVMCLKFDNLLDYHALYAHQCVNKECSYFHIRLRHVLCSDM